MFGLPKFPQRRKYWPAGGSEVPTGITQAGMSFIDEHSRWLDFVVFFQEGRLDRLDKPLDLIERHEEFEQLKDALEKLNAQMDEYRHHLGQMAELMVAKTVDNFLTYISDLLAEIYKQRPEMLKSNEQERLEFILQFNTMDELRNAVAEKKVERLAYLGLRELDEYLTAHMAFPLFPDEDDKLQAALIVEYRNLLAHNRGKVSARSAQRFPQLASLTGTRVTMSHDELYEMRQFLAHAMFDVDARAAAKFSLQTHSIPRPPDDLLTSDMRPNTSLNRTREG
jgi:hypothetical protein